MRVTNEDFDLEGVDDPRLLEAKRLARDNVIALADIQLIEARSYSLIPAESKIRAMIESLYVEYDAWLECGDPESPQAKYCLESITSWEMRLDGKCGHPWSGKDHVSSFCGLIYGHRDEHENRPIATTDTGGSRFNEELLEVQEQIKRLIGPTAGRP